MPLPRQAWGNTPGWTLAGALGVAIVLVLVVFHRAGSATPATAFGADPANYGAIALPIELDTLLLEAPADAVQNGGRAYEAAADGYLASFATRRTYESFATGNPQRPAGAGEMPLLDHLLEAARCRSATIFADEPDALINYERDPARLEALHVMGQAAIRQAGLLAARDEPGDAGRARELFEAALVLGARLCEERVVHRELELGYRLVSGALGGLSALSRKHGESARAIRLGEARQRFTDYINTRVQPTWEKIGAINDLSRTNDLADIHAGDIAVIATHAAADPMWRTEAILRLGKQRHDATRRADRRMAERLLLRLRETTRDDPRLRHAVERALALTAAERMVAR